MSESLDGTGAFVDPGPRIRAYLERVAHAGHGVQRDGESYSTDSAVWYVEAALNYALVAPDREFDASSTDSVVLEMPCVDSQVSAAELHAASATVLTTVMGLTTDMQHVHLVDVYVASQSTSSLVLQVVCYIGSGYERGAPSTNYGDDGTNMRHWGDLTNAVQPNTQCKCGLQPLNHVRCMDKEIETRINTANPIGTGAYFTSVETWQVNEFATNIGQKRYRFNDPFLAQPNDPTTSGDGCFDTRTFSWFTWAGCDQSCQGVPSQVFWTNSTWATVNLIRGTHCPPKSFKSCIITSGMFLVQGQIEHTDIHKCSFSYGLKQIK